MTVMEFLVFLSSLLCGTAEEEHGYHRSVVSVTRITFELLYDLACCWVSNYCSIAPTVTGRWTIFSPFDKSVQAMQLESGESRLVVVRELLLAMISFWLENFFIVSSFSGCPERTGEHDEKSIQMLFSVC